MKKIGEYTAKGQVQTADSGGKKILLFDGQTDTAYKVIGFEVRFADRDDTAIEVLSAKLSTEPSADNTTWNWANNTEIAWASAAHDANGLSTQQPATTIDPDNLIVEDLYVSVYSFSDTETANYIIYMEKYDITDSQGALAMVRNRSQA